MTLTTNTTTLSAQHCLHLARSWQLRGDLERAIAGYQEVIRLAPDHPLAYQLLGKLYSKEQQFEAAANIYIKALEAHPNMAEFHKGLTNALIQTQGLEQAFEHYRLRQISDNPPVIAPDAILCCMVVRNEDLRLPYLLSYYRQKGVDHFLIIDNGSTDNTQAYLLEQSDVTLWQGDRPFSYVNCGSAWFELLLRKYGIDHWCLIVDADELLYYSDCETRTLRQLCADLDQQHQRVLTAVLLDMYSDCPIQETHYQPGQDFLAVCPYFDRQFYHRKEENPAPYHNQARYIGGMRERVFGGEYWLNKVPLIKYSPAMILTGGQHHIGVSADQIATETGAVLHFKYFDSFDHYVSQEVERQEHADIRQYQAYARCLNEANSLILYDPSVSLRLRDSQQLVELSVMQAREQATLTLATDLPQVLPVSSQIYSPSELERCNTETPLMKVAEQGDVESAESLLDQGVDPNEQNDLGQTALHLAVKGGHVSLAACLLAYGEDHTLPNKNGHIPLGQDYTNPATLHCIRQHYHRFKAHSQSHGTSKNVDAWCTDLEKSGIIKIPGLVEPSVLSQLRADFQKFIHSLQQKILRKQGIHQHYDQEDYWGIKDRAFITNNAFKYSTALVQLCCNQILLELIKQYFAREGLIQRGVAMRYLPSETTDHNMFGWHHDMEDQRLKLMILLTDVGEKDQYMSYVLGSHKLFHPYEMFFNNTCSLEYCREHLGELEIFNTIGQAGDIFIFDSNGAHRGNRKPGAQTRDAFFIEYTTDTSDIWGGDIPEDAFHALPLNGANPFSQMLTVKKKWENPLTRKSPTWIENLPYPAQWLHSWPK